MDTLKSSVKFKTTMRGLDIIQTVYALLIALGLREVFLAFYAIFLQQRVAPIENFTVAALLFGNIILLSLRFFWVPRNLRRLYFVAEYGRIRNRAAGGGDAPIMPAYETSAHICVILMHGALYFLVCKEFEYYVFVSTSYNSYSRSVFATYVFVHASLLIFNALWLAFVNMREDAIRKVHLAGEVPPFLISKSESKLWYRSNLVFGLLAIAPLAVFSSCDSELPACLSVAYSESQRPFAVIPTSSFNIAFFFEYVARIFSSLNLPGSRDFLLAIWALTAFAINSVIDLFCTAPYYINLEEFEEEAVYTEKP